jgi:Cysteine-rich secretory protein family
MKVLFLVLLGFGSLTFGQVLQASYEPLVGNVVLELDLLGKTNAARAENNLSALQLDETLSLAARHHALEMATLNYFSHQSPTPGNTTPPERIANAGSPYLTVGENIAKMPPMLVINLANETVTGWMNSPGHRANLLETRFTHVGFGLAKDSQGFTYVVQNFAYEPFALRSAEVKSKSQASYLIVLEVTLPQPSTAAFSYGSGVTEPTQLQGGTNQVEFSTTEANQLYIQGAVPSPTGGGYIFQDGGWLTLATGLYQADTLTPKTYLQITNATARIRSSSVNEVTITLEDATETSLAVFVNDTYEPNAVVAPGVVRVALPSDATQTKISMGEVLPGNQVNVSMGFMLETNGGKLVLIASNAQTLH